MLRPRKSPQKRRRSRMNERLMFRDAEREGILTKNPLYSSGVIIAPAAAACTSFYSGAILAAVFTAVTFVTIALCSFVPRKIVYTFRIILYTVVASLVYVPVHLFFMSGEVLSQMYLAVGIYAPLLITNSLITLRTETKFYRLARPYMLKLAAFYVIGYDLALLTFGGIRGFLSTGTVLGIKVLPFSIPIFSTLFGGFILLAAVSAAFRWILQIISGAYKEQP